MQAREFGAGPLFNQILPILTLPTLEDQERHLLVKVIDRILYKLDDMVRPYVHKILVVIQPLLIYEVRRVSIFIRVGVGITAVVRMFCYFACRVKVLVFASSDGLSLQFPFRTTMPAWKDERSSPTWPRRQACAGPMFL